MCKHATSDLAMSVGKDLRAVGIGTPSPCREATRQIGLSNLVAFSSKPCAGSLRSIKKIQAKLEKRIRVKLDSPVG